MQSCNTIGNGQLKRSHPSCPGRRLAHFHMRLVPFFHAIRHRAFQCHIFIYFFYKALAGGLRLLFGSGFWVTRCGLEGFCTIWGGGGSNVLNTMVVGGVRICISRPCLKKPPWPPARAFQKNNKMGRKKYDKRSANQNMHSQKKKGTQQKFARNAPGWPKMSRPNFYWDL